MKVEFAQLFYKDIKRIKDYKLRQRIAASIVSLEEAKKLSEVSHLIKVKGHSSAYRIRIGEYRLGIFADGDRVMVARFLKRNDIYKVFP
ncbi:MAG: mRNA interferase RelE/StbE [Granulosicoccus sp.]|jgi:mRNA interferase RelE/StbE